MCRTGQTNGRSSGIALHARLLVADGETSIRELFSSRLRRLGYHVDLAGEGSQILGLLERHPYDLVLLGLKMPGLPGLEVLERIREKWNPSDLPVMMVTDMEASVEMVSALRLGANDYLTRPLDFSIALARIEMQLRLAFAVREVRRANDFYHLALRASEEGLWDWNVSTGQVYYSEPWKQMLGFADGEISASAEEWFGRLHPDDRSRVTAEIQAQVEGNLASVETEYRIRHKDGRYRWVENRGSASRDASGRVVRIAGCQTDITTRKTIDPATGLLNRAWLEQLGSFETGGRPAALLLIDVERFDELVESLPSGGADRLLIAIGTQLSQSLQAIGAAAAAAIRSGDHQFAVFAREIPDQEHAQRLAEAIQTSLAKPLPVGDEPVFVTVCLGIALTAGDLAGRRLLGNATAALRRARERGTRVEVFEAAMRQQDLAETRLVNDLRRAIERSEFTVLYQPKVDLATQRIAGFEALVRWKRPGYGIVQPNDFIVTAERTGLIVPIGRYVLERSCHDAAALRCAFPRVGVSVNVSGRQLAEPDLVEQVREALSDTGLDPHALRLEITETFLVENPEQALHTLKQFKGMGVGLKLDDFGSGYSSLDYLRRFPFDTIKIDRSFVSRLDSSRECAEIVRAVAGLARSLRMEMVAEGIENQVQLDWLRNLGCRYGQGYWFSPPVELQRLRELLESGCHWGTKGERIEPCRLPAAQGEWQNTPGDPLPQPLTSAVHR